MIPVILWSNHDDVSAADQWDFGLLRLMFEGKLWTSPFDFLLLALGRTAAVQSVPYSPHVGPVVFGEGNRAVVVVPARHHADPDDVAALNLFISTVAGVVLVLIGDEEAVFPWRDVMHPNICFWVMHPDPIKHADMSQWAYFIGTGFKDDTPEMLRSSEMPAKNISWAFAGQSTHARRKQAVNALRVLKERQAGALIETEGFTQGLPRQQYLDLLLDSKVAICPSGPATPDTFRFYEALEAGCVPIVDSGPDGMSDYWRFVYGAFPFRTVQDWDDRIIEKVVTNAAPLLPAASAWWQQQKRAMVKRMDADLLAIGAVPDRAKPKVTVIVTSSPIPSHPSLDILDHTMTSIAAALGNEVETIITCDGIRPQQRELESAYWEYEREVCWRAEHNRANTLPVISQQHVHQAGMLRKALEFVDTDVVLFMEHDTPLSTAPEDYIDWARCIDLLAYGSLDVLRFHHEAAIHPEHEHLMLDHDTIGMAGVPLRRTIQWSQRPHLARTAYYREVLDRYFLPDGSAFIEDKMYSVVQSDKSMPHRIAIYHPTGSIRRSFHTDGRAGGPKFDELQIL